MGLDLPVQLQHITAWDKEVLKSAARVFCNTYIPSDEPQTGGAGILILVGDSL